MTLEEMKKKRAEKGITYEQLSRLSGVPLPTIQKIFCGRTKSPRYTTLSALEKVLSDKNDPPASQHNSTSYSYLSDIGFDGRDLSHEMVGETHGVYRIDGTSAREREGGGEKNGLPVQRKSKGFLEEYNTHIYDRQGTYTLDDYLALPDDQRVELIDGCFYDMSSPYSTHQTIVNQLSYLFNRFIDENNGSCTVFDAPTDVQLDRDNKTIVEPDVMIVCHPERITLQRIYGSPDLVVEVLSYSTRRKDMTLKLWKYANAGVREYWIVDADQQKVYVYFFEKDLAPDIYSFHDKVPVGIYDGKLKIDFERIWKKIERFYPEARKYRND